MNTRSQRQGMSNTNTRSQRQVLSSLTLFNKLVNIINNEEKLTTNENDEMITGGVILNETIDNLVGGNQQSPSIADMKQTQKPITKELNENLFEGGNQQSPTVGEDMQPQANALDTKEDTKEDMQPQTTSEDNEDDYAMFLHRLKTKQLFMQSSSNSLDVQSPIIGGNSKDENDIDVLPMFPYLVRY